MGDSAQREMTLDEWCERLPGFHLVNKQLTEIKSQLTASEEKVSALEKQLNSCDGCCVKQFDICEREETCYKKKLTSSEKERERLMGALTRQSDNMSFILNKMPLPDYWYMKFRDELRIDREALKTEKGEG